jgi:hypothetical protein
MTDVKIKVDEKGNPEVPSVATVNKKIEAFVEILIAKFQQQHDQIRSLEQQVKRLEAIVTKKSG